MSFFTTFYNSLWNLPWLKAHRSAFGKAWGYFALFTLLTTALMVLPVAFELPGAVREAKALIETKVPEFKATLAQGQFTVEQLPQPYTLREQGVLFMVDTVSTTTPELAKVMGNETLGILLTREGMEMVNRESGTGQKQPWVGLSDFSATKTDLLQFIDRSTKPSVLILIVLGMALVVYLVAFCARLVFAVVASLLMRLVAMATKRTWTFVELFTVSLFGVTLSTLVSKVVGAFMPLPYLHFLTLAAFLLAVLVTNEEKPVEETEMEPEQE